MTKGNFQLLHATDDQVSYNFSHVNMFKTMTQPSVVGRHDSNRSITEKVKLNNFPDIMPFGYGVENSIEDLEFKKSIRLRRMMAKKEQSLLVQQFEDTAEEAIDLVLDKFQTDLLQDALSDLVNQLPKQIEAEEFATVIDKEN